MNVFACLFFIGITDRPFFVFVPTLLPKLAPVSIIPLLVRQWALSKSAFSYYRLVQTS